MTITTQTARAQYNGDGATTEFAIPFEFLETGDVLVIHTDGDGVDTTWVLDTQYAVTNADGTPITTRTQPTTGKVVVDTSPTDYTPATGEKLTILRNQALTQSASYTPGDAFPAKAHEKALDRLSMQIQTVNEKLARAPKLKSTSATSGITFPEPVASKVIAWNSAGDDLENKTTVPGEGDMLATIYDPQGIEDDAFARANHTGTQLAATISDFSTAADLRITAASGTAFLSPAAIAAAYQPLDADLTSWAGVTRASGFDTFAATPSSANLRALLSDEVGTGEAYFVGGALGTPASATLTNATGLPASGLVASTSQAVGFGSIELGHATDTTLSRGAAGFLAVEGKRVPSPASQASGDVLYRGATEWERLAKGTAGQVLTMNAGATAPEWAAGGGGGSLPTGYTSAQQTITAAGSLTLAHGLGSKPRLVSISLVCLTAELNYSIGDELILGVPMSLSSISRGVSVVADATNLNIRYGSDANTFGALNKTTGAIATLTNSRWEMVVRAWI